MNPPLPIKERLAQPDNVALVHQLLDSRPALTRTQLAHQLCRRLALRDPKGDLQIATTARALRELEAAGHWTLPPPAVARPHASTSSPARPAHRVAPAQGVPACLEDLQNLALIEVRTPQQLLLWNELMIREHPLHDARLVGRQFRYLIGSDHGWLGGLGFGSAALYLESRDTWLGWSNAQRSEHLPRVINMTRFLIRPTVRCPNLASHVLGLCARRIATDFERRYRVRPWLMESFVDPSAYEGTCYQAANWVQVGQTQGRGRNGAHDAGLSRKDVYLYPLVADLDARLGVERFPWTARAPHEGLEGDNWAEQEFGTCALGDRRLTRRLVKIATDEAAHPGASHTQAAGGDAHQAKGCYRLLKNPRAEIHPTSLLQAHRTQTLRRCKALRTVLAVQDTTGLDFTNLAQCTGLGETKANQTSATLRSLKLHSLLAIEPETGLPLGVLRLDGYAPESAQGKDPFRPIEQKESFRWIEALQETNASAALLPDTHFIAVTDREGDFFELFDWQRRQAGPKAALLVRAQYDRKLAGGDAKLFAETAGAPLAETFKLTVPRQREHLAKPSAPGRPGLRARAAAVKLRYQEVSLPPPATPALRDRSPVRVWAVLVDEKNPPPGAEAIHWVLLTTVEVRSKKQARRCLRWYCRRWRIEEWHRVLKSGCKVPEHQHRDAATLLRAITLDAVIAWRILLLGLLGRTVPGLPAEWVFDACECEVLQLLAQKKSSPWGKP